MPSWAVAFERIQRCCAAPVSSKQLRLAMLEVMASVLPYDAHVWLLTDPVTRVGTEPLADIPGLPWHELPELIRLRYLTDDWTAFCPDGVADVATSIYADKFGCWAWLDLWRTEGAFSVAEREFLASLLPVITAALRAAQARTFSAASTAPTLPAAAVVILGPDLRPKGRTSAAAQALWRLNPPDEGIPLVPAAAYNVAAALLGVEAGGAINAAWSRVHLGGSCWVTLTAARMDEGDIAISIEPSTSAQRREVFALAHALSARERQVLDELATGADTTTIAQRLVISEHTVNDHVKAILGKAGQPTRSRLLAHITG